MHLRLQQWLRSNYNSHRAEYVYSTGLLSPKLTIHQSPTPRTQTKRLQLHVATSSVLSDPSSASPCVQQPSIKHCGILYRQLCTATKTQQRSQSALGKACRTSEAWNPICGTLCGNVIAKLRVRLWALGSVWWCGVPCLHGSSERRSLEGDMLWNALHGDTVDEFFNTGNLLHNDLPLKYVSIRRHLCHIIASVKINFWIWGKNTTKWWPT